MNQITKNYTLNLKPYNAVIAFLIIFSFMPLHALEIKLADNFLHKWKHNETELEKVNVFLNKVKQKLPLKVKESVSEVSISFQNLNSFSHSNTIVGKSYSQQIILDDQILNQILNSIITDKINNESAERVLLHEMAHIYDSILHVSTRADFLSATGWKSKSRSKNNTPMRSPDLYEYKNAQEYFAVNFENFILDKNFACRRPVQFNFYKSEFNLNPFNAVCAEDISVFNSNKLAFQKINPKKVIAIDYLLAGPGTTMASRFGHTMLRLVICDDERLKNENLTPGDHCRKDINTNLVISYRANVMEMSINVLSGIFGKYPSEIFFFNLSDIIKEYTDVELRDVYSFPLQLSEDQKNKIVLSAASNYWEYRGKYKFFSTNCATETRDLLKTNLTEMQLNLLTSHTPIGVLKNLYESNLLEKNNHISFLLKKLYRKDFLISDEAIAEREAVYFKSVRPTLEKAILHLSLNKVLISNMTFEQYKALDFSYRASLIEKVKNDSELSALYYLERKVFLQEQQEVYVKLAKFIQQHSENEISKKLREEFAMDYKSKYTVSGYGLPTHDELNHLFQLDNSKATVKSKLMQQILNDYFPNELRKIDLAEKNLITLAGKFK